MVKWLCTLIVLATSGMAQQTAPKKDAASEKKEPAPLFEGKLGIRSSQKTKESATLGFNGIDPSGRVDAKMLAASPGAAEEEKVKQMGVTRPLPEELKAFLAEGGLKAK